MLTTLVSAAGLLLLSPVHFKRALQHRKEMTVQLHSGVDNHCEKEKVLTLSGNRVFFTGHELMATAETMARFMSRCSHIRPSVSVSFKSEQTDMCLQLWEIRQRCTGSPGGRIIPSLGFYSTVRIFETHEKQTSTGVLEIQIKMSVPRYEELAKHLHVINSIFLFNDQHR